MVDTCAAEFAAETPYFYSTYAAAGLRARGAAGRPPAALVIGSGPVRIGQGIEFDYCAVQAADIAPPRRLERGDDQLRTRRPSRPTSTPRTPAVLRAARPGERPERRSTPRAPDRRRARSRAVVALRRPDAAQPGRAARAAGVPLLGSDLETIDQAEERTRFSALLDRLGHPAAGRRDGPRDRGGADARRAHRLPGHRPAVVRHRRPRASTSATRRRTSSASSRRRPSSTPTGPSASTATSRASRSTSTPCQRRRASPDPGPPRARRAGRRPLAATRSAMFPPQTVGRGRPGA